MSVVLITGCSSGMGLASALAMARAGDTVYASMRNPARAGELQEAATREGLDIRVVKLDVTEPAEFAPVVANVVKESGRLDVLVNNAGVLRPGAFEDVNEAALRLVMETNFIGPMLLTRAVLPQMRAQRSGYIIMISSLSGVAGLPGDVTYTGSKFALEGATEALRHEVDRWGINVALIEAGLYATGIFDLPSSDDTVLPDDYPADSPYRSLVEYKLREVRDRLADALDPGIIGELIVEISRSDGRQLRWPADATARSVLATMFGHDDAGRDEFLRGVSGTEWWSAGSEPPSSK